MSIEAARVSIKNIEFCNGNTIGLKDNSIVVFVGPNNSGKSLSLKEIFLLSKNSRTDTRCIKSLSLDKSGKLPNIVSKSASYKSSSSDLYYFEGSSYEYKTESDIEKMWASNDDLGSLVNLFFAHLPTSDRLSDSEPAANFDAVKTKFGNHPIHSLYLNSDKENEISEIFREYFDLDLVVHRSAGNKIPLYVGNRPKLEGTETAASRTYLDRLERLDLLGDQGDGLRSFCSILLRVRTGAHSVILVDEPEAFLHPPQARAVAELISAGGEEQKQIFIATHSNDVIQGILSKFPDRVSIVRIERTGQTNKITSLSNERIAELWRDPILRYSNTLNGIFHHQVIITESDGDCRFYEAMADVIEKNNKSTFYTYAGGKDRIAVIVKALEGLQVPTRSVVDMDIIATDKTLQRIIESYGKNWEEYRLSIVGIHNVIKNRKSWLLGAGFKERINLAIATIKDTEIVPKNILDRIKVAMRETSPWEAIKTGGVSAFPQGDPARNINDLLTNLRQDNIFVVPVGEMERFCTTVSSHGPQWVAEVLERDLLNDPELNQARSFVRDLVQFSHDEAISIRRNSRSVPIQIRRVRRFFTMRRAKDVLIITSKISQTFFFVSIGIFLLISSFISIINWLSHRGS